MNEETWFVVVNPRAGRTGATADQLRSLLDASGLVASVIETESVAHLHSAVSHAVALGTRRFVSVGGDGSAHHLVNSFADLIGGSDRRFTLAIIPGGSGCDFVRTFGHSRDMAIAVARLINPTLYPIDLGSISGSFGHTLFLNAANVGVAAASAEVAARLPDRLGATRYAAGFWLALARFRAANISVGIERHSFAGTAINVVVANGQFFGGGMNIAPRATLVDGELDVQVFSGPRRLAFSVMPRVVRGTHLTHTAVRRYVGSSISIAVPKTWPVESDGELLGHGPVTIETIPAAIDFVV